MMLVDKPTDVSLHNIQASQNVAALVAHSVSVLWIVLFIKLAEMKHHGLVLKLIRILWPTFNEP